MICHYPKVFQAECIGIPIASICYMLLGALGIPWHSLAFRADSHYEFRRLSDDQDAYADPTRKRTYTH